MRGVRKGSRPALFQHMGTYCLRAICWEDVCSLLAHTLPASVVWAYPPGCPVSSLCHCCPVGTSAVLWVLKLESMSLWTLLFFKIAVLLKMKVTGIWKDFCIGSEGNFRHSHYPSYLTSWFAHTESSHLFYLPLFLLAVLWFSMNMSLTGLVKSNI